MLAFFANGAHAEFLRLRAGGAGRAGQQPRRHHRRPGARPVPAGGELPRSAACSPRSRCSWCSSSVLLAAPQGLFGAPVGAAGMMQRGRGSLVTARAGTRRAPRRPVCALRCRSLLLFGGALVLPFAGNDYWAVIATRAAIYWVLVVRPQSGGRLRRPARHRLCRAADAGRLHRQRPGGGQLRTVLTAVRRAGRRRRRGRGRRRDHRPAGAAAAHLLLRHDHARLRHHRHPGGAGLAERDRRRRRRGRARCCRRRSTRPGASTSSAWPSPRCAPG